MGVPRSKRRAHRTEWLTRAAIRLEIARQQLMAEITTAHQEGWHVEEIAEATELSPKQVRKLLRESRENNVRAD